MKNRRFRSISLIAIGILVIALIFLAGGCTRTSVFIPEALQLEPPPQMITPAQLYAEYMADEAAADAKYKGKKIWVIEANVDSYLESESGNYLMMRWYQPPLAYPGPDIERVAEADLIYPPSYCLSTVKLEPKSSAGFKDVGDDYVVEIIGECDGISEGVVTLKLIGLLKPG